MSSSSASAIPAPAVIPVTSPPVETLTPHQLFTLLGFDPEYPPVPFEYRLTSKLLLQKLRSGDFQLVPGAPRLLKLVEAANKRQIEYYCLPCWKRNSGQIVWLIVGVLLVGAAVTVSVCSYGLLAPTVVAVLKPALATAFACAGGGVLREVHAKWNANTYRHSRFLKIAASKFAAGLLAGAAGGLIAPSLPALTSLLGVPEVLLETITEATLTALATTLSEYVIKKWPGWKSFAKEIALTALGCFLVFGLLNLCPAHAATHHINGDAAAAPALNQEWTDVATEILAQQRGFTVTADAVFHMLQFTGEKCAHLFAKSQLSHHQKLSDILLTENGNHPHQIKFEVVNNGAYFLNGYAVYTPTNRWRNLAAFMSRAGQDHSFADIKQQGLASNLLEHQVFDADKPLTLSCSQNRLEDRVTLVYFKALRFYGWRPVKKYREFVHDERTSKSWPVFLHNSSYYAQAFRVYVRPEVMTDDVTVRFCFEGLTAQERCVRIEYDVGKESVGRIDVTAMPQRSVRHLRYRDNTAVGVCVVDDSVVEETFQGADDNNIEVDPNAEEQELV